MAEPDLFASIVEAAPDRAIDVDMARYAVDPDHGRLALCFDVRVRVRGQETPRLAELRMKLTPFSLAALVRDGRRALEQMGQDGMLRAEGEPPNNWAGATGVAL